MPAPSSYQHDAEKEVADELGGEWVNRGGDLGLHYDILMPDGTRIDVKTVTKQYRGIGNLTIPKQFEGREVDVFCLYDDTIIGFIDRDDVKGLTMEPPSRFRPYVRVARSDLRGRL